MRPEFDRRALLAALAATTLAGAARAGADGEVKIVYGEWTDPDRDGRTVPYKLYLPAATAPAATVIHSHGLGGTRDASAYILEAVARAGLAVVALQHAGSDSGIWRGVGGLRALEAGQIKLDPSAGPQRFQDLRFAVRTLDRETASGPYAGRFDMGRLGMSGHSFGALSTLVALGQDVPGAGGRFREPRLKVGIVYSPNKPRNQDAAQALRDVHTPILHFTGTEDSTQLDLEKTPWERTLPFQVIGGADQYLVVLHGGDHMIFSGRRQAEGRLKPGDPAQMALVQAETVRFWRAYLGGDAQALGELCSLPDRVRTEADGYVKATSCGAPTPLPR